MRKALRIILVIIVFIIFFEVGLISSYTIVTSEVPDVKGMIDMQIEKITTIFSPDSVGQVMMKDPTTVKINNKEDVALKIQALTDVDGINIDSMNVTTYDDTDDEEINVTITSLGYEDPTSGNSSSLVLSSTPSYKVVASATAHLKNGKFEVDDKTIKISSVLKLA